MEQYIGTKIIKGTEMNLGDYNNKRGWIIPENEDPKREGYYVEYADGYPSWSPKEVFEEAYRASDALPFGLAVEALKKGLKVSRTGWNGKGMWLRLAPASSYNALFENDNAVEEILPWIAMKTVDNKLVPWLASQTDVLADDWCLLD